MKKRLVQLLGLFLCLQCCYMSGMKVTAKGSNTTVDVVQLLKDEIHETKHWDENTSDSTLDLTQEDAWRLMKIAQAEAGTEGMKGQLLVMTVVINRLCSSDFPNTIAEVISQESQFETYWNGMYTITEPTVDSHLALAQLESNKDLDKTIIGFETVTNGDALLKYFDYKFTYKNHNFYTLKKD